MPRRKTVYGNQHLKVHRLQQVKKGISYCSRQWYGRRRHRGRSYYFPLGEDEKKALSTWRTIKEKIRDPDISFESILEGHMPGHIAMKTGKQPIKVIHAADLTIDDYIDFIWTIKSALEMKPRTLKDYIASLLRLTAVGLAEQAGKENPTTVLNEKQKTALRRKPLSILSRRLVHHFKVAMVEAAEDEGRSAISARRSVNSYLRQARSLFSEEILQTAEDHHIKLPDLTGFLKAQGFKKVKVRYLLPDERLIKKTFEHLSDPAKAPPRDVYIAILLGLFGGIRKGEVAFASPAQLTTSNKRPGINVTTSTKNYKSRFVPLQVRVFEALKSYGINGPYFFEGSPTYRKRELMDEANAWLRKLGWKVSKPYHELRKLLGSMIATTESKQAAQIILDHESITTTEEYYADITMSEEISALWSSFVPVALEELKASTNSTKKE